MIVRKHFALNRGFDEQVGQPEWRIGRILKSKVT